MVDQFGTPHTQALHVIERYRLIDYEVAKEALERGAKENASFVRNDSGLIVTPRPSTCSSNSQTRLMGSVGMPPRGSLHSVRKFTRRDWTLLT